MSKRLFRLLQRLGILWVCLIFFSSDNYHKVFPSKPLFFVLWLKTVTAQSTSENEAFSNTHGPIYEEKMR